MKKLVNFVFWPALAGLVLAIALLQGPRLTRLFPSLQPAPPVVQQPANADSLTFSAAIRKALPAVVSINNLQLVNKKITQKAAFQFNRSTTLIGDLVRNIEDSNTTLGSGIIINPEGYIITSYHVMFNPELDILRPEQDITVTLSDGSNVEAQLVSLDAKNDLALLKIDSANLSYLQLADTGNLQIGDIVLAIGNPRNIGQSVSFGIISALWKQGDSYVIQTDAAINPGNSGGALIDTDGKLVGINSTIVSQSGGSEGISFAVPASKGLDLLARHLTAQKLDTGNSGYLGVDAESVLLTIGGQERQGVLIGRVTPGSAAALADIRSGDIITAVNGVRLPLVQPRDLQAENEEATAEAYRMLATITDHPPGELVMLEVFRDGELTRVPTILGIGEPRVYVEQTPVDDEVKAEALPDSFREVPTRD